MHNPAEAHSQLAALLEVSSDAIFATTLDGTVTLWSPAATGLFGYRPGDIMGRSGAVLISPESLAVSSEIRHIIAAGERAEARSICGIASDGEYLDLILDASPIFDTHGAVTGAVFVARIPFHSVDTHNRTLVLETANRVALDILANRTGVEALRHIADAARIIAGARYAALGVAQPNGPGLSEFITVGLTPAEEAAIGPLPKGKGVLGALLGRTDPLRVDRLSDHPASVGFPLGHPPMDSFLGVPIRRGDNILGSLYLTNKQGGGAFTEADEVAVQALGAHAAIAIYNLHMVAQQRSLLSGLITAQEEERRAVAYDLHDGLTQHVMAAHAHFESFKRANATGNKEKAGRDLDSGLNYLHEAVVESRRLVNGLRSLALDDLGLAGALEQLLSEEKARASWESADFIHNIAGCRFDKNLETGAYRVAQEAITNIRKHASAKQVRVLLLAEEGLSKTRSLRLEILDRGRGFVPEEHSSGHLHVGLQGIAERINLLGGKYELRSSVGEGTLLQAIFPILETPASEERS